MSKTNKTDAKKSVLIVEDSIDFSNLLKFIVEDEQAKPDTAGQENPPTKERIRTLPQARAARGLVAGAPMKQGGGVHRRARIASIEPSGLQTFDAEHHAASSSPR